jgi:hypothetical protein
MIFESSSVVQTVDAVALTASLRALKLKPLVDAVTNAAAFPVTKMYHLK